MRVSVILTATIALVACASVQRMTADQVRTTFVGVTDYGTYQGGKSFVAYLAPDGTITMQHEGQTDIGQYHIEPDGQLCIQYHTQQQDGDACQTMWQGNGEYYSTLSDGRAGAIIATVKPGNAAHL